MAKTEKTLEAIEAIERVGALHQVAHRDVEKWAEGYRFTGEHCSFDGEHWPCLTIRVMRGEQ